MQDDGGFGLVEFDLGPLDWVGILFGSIVASQSGSFATGMESMG
jgi:hypothetical protein